MFRNRYRQLGVHRLLCAVVLGTIAVPLAAQELKDPMPGVDLGFGAPMRATGGPDVFGYTFADQDEATCALQFIDVSTSGTPIDWGFGSFDDNASDPLALGASFSFYGTDYSELVMSTNGYISTDPTDPGTSLGGGFPDQSLCPLPDSLLSGGGARMFPLLDDLVTETAFVEYFSDCPRASDRCRAVEDCTVFLWHDTHHFGQPEARFNVEAVLYHQTNDIIFYVGPGNPELGEASTTGIQSEPTDPLPPTYPTGLPESGLTYACDTADSVADNTSVCFFHPNSVPDACVYSDLEITKVSDASVREEPGSLVVYTLTVTNNGPDDARGTQVTDELDAGTAWVSDDCAAGPPAGSVWTWNIASLPSGSLAACNLTVMVTGDRGTTVENTATVDIDNFDTDTANNTSATTSFDVGFISDVGIEKTSDAVGLVPSGSPVVYTLTVGNDGPDEAIGVTVTDDLPPGAVYASNDCGAAAPAGTLFTWNAGNVPFVPLRGNVPFVPLRGNRTSGASVSCNVTVTAYLPPIGDLIVIEDVHNLATVAVDNIDPDTANDFDTTTFTVILVPLVFVDSFETGNTSRWSSTVPPP